MAAVRIVEVADIAGEVARGTGEPVARLGEPTGEFPALAYAARRMVGGLSLRAVANKTDGVVSHDTVKRLLNGEKIGEDKLDALSRACGQDPNILRRAGEYPPLVAWGEESRASTARERPELTYEPDIDSIPVPDGYYDLDTAGRIAARKAAEEHFRTVVEAIKLSRQLSPGTVGFGADRYRPDGRTAGRAAETIDITEEGAHNDGSDISDAAAGGASEGSKSD